MGLPVMEAIEMRLVSVVLLAAMMASLPTLEAGAAEVYLGVNVGRSDTPPVSGGHPAPISDSDGAYALLVGVRPLDWFAVEVKRVDLGKIEQAPGYCCDLFAFNARQDSLAVVGNFLYRTKHIDMSLRIGFADWEMDGLIEGGFAPMHRHTGSSTTDLLLGVGLQRRIGRFALRLDYDKWEHDDIVVPGMGVRFRAPDLLSVGMTWEFP